MRMGPRDYSGLSFDIRIRPCFSLPLFGIGCPNPFINRKRGQEEKRGLGLRGGLNVLWGKKRKGKFEKAGKVPS